MYYYLIMFIMLFAISVDAQELRAKPVKCGDMASLLRVLDNANEKAIVGGLSEVTMEGGSTQILPVYLFVNTDKGSFTIIEVQAQAGVVCVIGHGNSIDFDVQKYFEKKSTT